MDRRWIIVAFLIIAACIAGAVVEQGGSTQQSGLIKSSPAQTDLRQVSQNSAANQQGFSGMGELVTGPPTDPSKLDLTEQDIRILGQLPPVCTSELPGLGQKLPLNHVSGNAMPDRQLQPAVKPAAYQSESESQIQFASLPQMPAAPFIETNLQNPEASSISVDRKGISAAASNAYADLFQPSGHEQGQVTPASYASMNPHAKSSEASRTGVESASGNATSNGEDPHWEIYSRTAYPSAEECAACHQQIYEEWASSSHAYASVSPMFHSFESTINKLSQGTIGYFCMRCHAPVATTMGLRRDQAIWDGPKVFREGVTCVACHRVKTPYGKENGERRMEPGDIHAPVYGTSDGSGVAAASKYADYLKVKTDPKSKSTGQPIHRRAIEFEELSESTFCVSCHQVAVQPGIKLEVVWDQYRNSPAHRQGITCQDCHMGIEPGIAEGYSVGPAAVIDGKVVNPDRQHSNHMFFGPGYSIAHPGTFPHTKEANRWKFNDWLLFDWRAGWGTDEFEDALADGKVSSRFPEVWQDADDRYDAREIIDANLKKLEYKKDIRRQLMENGSQLDGPFFGCDPALGEPLRFHYCVTNTNPGHNMPSGSLGAQPQLWLNVVLIGPRGNWLWESGYLDSNGDLADLHSLDVAAKRIPLDRQLFNLQTKFLTTGAKGTDREMYLPVNVDIDQLPFLRPAREPVSVINHPPFIRMEAHSLPPLGSRKAKYVVPAELVQEPGVYRLSVRMRSRAEPIYFMRFCNATPEMERMMNEWICDFHEHSVTFEVR